MSIHFDRTKERNNQIKREQYLIRRLDNKSNPEPSRKVSHSIDQTNPFLRKSSTITRIKIHKNSDYQIPLEDIVLTPDTKGIRHYPSLGTLSTFQLFTELPEKTRKRSSANVNVLRYDNFKSNTKNDKEESWDKIEAITFDGRNPSPSEPRDLAFRTTDNFRSTFNRSTKYFRNKKFAEETQTDLTKFSENKTKYNFYKTYSQPVGGTFVRNRTSPGRKRSSKSEMQMEIDILKSSTKYSNKRNKEILANIRQQNIKKEEIDKIATMNDLNKQQFKITSEDEYKLKMVKAKVAISKIFYTKTMSDEERNHQYQKLLNEYRVERGLHDPSLCEEISTYLTSNKIYLLKDKTLADYGGYNGYGYGAYAGYTGYM